MVTFVTGKINSGKTTKLYELYQQTGRGDGYLAIKQMQGTKVVEYTAKRLSTDDAFPYVVRDEFDTGTKKIACSIGPYRFYQDAIDEIKREVRRMIEYSIEPIYLDEIGQLELKGECFADLFQELVDSGLDIVASVKKDLLEDIVKAFGIHDYKIVRTD
jgi:nucleoside-triphosphatase THEP1